MNNDEDFIYGILSKSLRISTEAARDFVHQMNEYLPNNFPPEVIYSNLLGLPYIYRTPPFVAWSIIARNKLDPGNKLPKPLLPHSYHQLRKGKPGWLELPMKTGRPFVTGSKSEKQWCSAANYSTSE